MASALYYVTSAQTPGNTPTFNIYIQKSTDDGASWSTVFDGGAGPLTTQQFDVLLIDDVLHIWGDNTNDPNFQPHLWVYRFDTATDLMLDAGTDLGVRFTAINGVKAAQFVGGSVLLAFQSIANTQTFIYDPTMNTISSGVVFDQSGGLKVFGAVVDTGTDTGFVFFEGQALGVPNEIDCVAVSNANVQQASVFAFNASGSTGANQLSRNVGRPVISGGQIQMIYVYAVSTVSPAVVGTLRVAKATPANSPAFTDDLVYTDAKPPYLNTLTSADWFIPTLVDDSGTLYAFFQTNVNQAEDGTSLASLLYATSTVPGTWSADSVAFTGPASTSALSCYPLALTAGGVGVIACYADPTTFPIAGSLLVKYIALPGPTSVTVSNGQSIAIPASNSIIGPTNLLFEVGSTPPTPFSVACPVFGGTATTGVPYNSGAPPVTGGTPPYFYTLLSGTLPDGFTLDPFTGIISGTTEQEGIFSYTLEVQDSSSPVQFAEVPDPCSIVVSINQGCRFKLLKLMPTFGPAKKLPVRGSVQ